MRDPFRENLAALEERANELHAQNAAVRAEIARLRAAGAVEPVAHPLRGPLLTLAAVFLVHALFWSLRGASVDEQVSTPHATVGANGEL